MLIQLILFGNLSHELLEFQYENERLPRHQLPRHSHRTLLFRTPKFPAALPLRLKVATFLMQNCLPRYHRRLYPLTSVDSHSDDGIPTLMSLRLAQSLLAMFYAAWHLHIHRLIHCNPLTLGGY
jgi:hypothetical protein